MKRTVLTQGDEFNSLLEPCAAVTVFDDDLQRIVDDMWDTMYAYQGVGLAAPQIGVRLRIAVIDTIQRESSYRRLVMVNPEIQSVDGEQVSEEGCLSMPGLRWPIPRSYTVTVTYQDLKGQQQTKITKALLARAVQHECDHLNGILCNSRAPKVEKPEATKPIMVIGR